MRTASMSSAETREPVKYYNKNSIGYRAHQKSLSNARPSLSDYINTILGLPLEQSMSALSTLLVSDLRSQLTVAGVRVVVHPAYSGSYPLNNLARRWMDQGRELRESTSPLLAVRLQHLELLREFKKLYQDSNLAVKRSCMAWLPASFRDFRVGCGCCLRDPLWCVPNEMRCDDALYFRPEVWRQCFGSEGLSEEDPQNPQGHVSSKFGSMSWSSDGEMQQRWKCDEKMIEDALRQEKNRLDTRSEVDEEWEDVREMQ